MVNNVLKEYRAITDFMSKTIYLACKLCTVIGAYIWKNGLQEGSIRIISNSLVVGQFVDPDYFLRPNSN